MVRKIGSIVILIFAVFIQGIFAAPFSASGANEAKVLPGWLVVKFKDALQANQGLQKGAVSGNATIDHFLSLSGSRLFKAFPNSAAPADPSRIDLSRIYKIKLPATEDPVVIARDLSSNPDIEYAEPLYLERMHYTPNDPDYGLQPNLTVMAVQQAWDVIKGDSTIIIGIVDSGVDLDHEDLAGRIWSNEDELPGDGNGDGFPGIAGIDDDGDGLIDEDSFGFQPGDAGYQNDLMDDDDENGFVDDFQGWDFVGADINNIQPDNDPDPKNGSSHGTHVAGLASAITDNQTGIASVAYGATIMVTKHGTDSPGNRTIALAYQGVKYMVDNGANVINCSWGGSSPSQYAMDIIRYAYEHGVVVVGSAGNNDGATIYAPPQTPPPNFPGSYHHVLSVANTRMNDMFSIGSLWGPYVDVCAPGTSVYSSTMNDTYSYYSGTSMSSPQVAGLAALVKLQHPHYTPDQVISQIKFTTDDISGLSNNSTYIAAGGIGTGRVNAYRAVTEPPSAMVQLNGYKIDDALTGNGNGRVDPGEIVGLQFEWLSLWGDMQDVRVQVETGNPNVTVLQDEIHLGDMAGGEIRVTNPLDLLLQVKEFALPQQVVLHITFTEAGGYRYSDSLQIAVSPLILLVDDDGLNDVRPYYTQVLDSLGYFYDIWDHQEQGNAGEVLLGYPVVIWFCEWNFPNLDAFDRRDIEAYLDAGGNFFLSGQDIGWDLCDSGPLGNDSENEFERSAGTSLDFYESYLKSKYVEDTSPLKELNGVPADPIGDGLGFSVFQPGLDAQNQYPDVIEALGNAVPVFEYPDGRAGALRFEGDYKLVHFAFGGYESITQDAVRPVVMRRIIDWFTGLEIEVDRLKDTEDITQDFPVTARVSSIDNLVAVDLYWRTSQGTFTRTPMAPGQDNRYSGVIPGQGEAGIEYFVYARTEKGYYSPFQLFSFYAGADQKPPVITGVTPIPASLSNLVTLAVSFKAVDNIGLNTASALVHYQTLTVKDSLLLDHGDGRFSGTITTPLIFGDTLSYHFSIVDLAQIPNRAVTPPYSLPVGVEDCEMGFLNWSAADFSGWSLDGLAHSGDYGFKWSPAAVIDGSDQTLQYIRPLDLSGLQQVTLRLHHFYIITRPDDYIGLQASVDSGKTWQAFGPRFKGILVNSGANRYLEEQVSLNGFAGQPHVLLRFDVHLAPGKPPVSNAYYVDDLSILPHATSVGESSGLAGSQPDRYQLMQNYPNPFNMSTAIHYTLAKSGDVVLSIYNVAGQQVQRLVDAFQESGNHQVVWNGRNTEGRIVPSGIYFYRLQSKGFVQIKKMSVIK